MRRRRSERRGSRQASPRRQAARRSPQRNRSMAARRSSTTQNLGCARTSYRNASKGAPSRTSAMFTPRVGRRSTRVPRQRPRPTVIPSQAKQLATPCACGSGSATSRSALVRCARGIFRRRCRCASRAQRRGDRSAASFRPREHLRRRFVARRQIEGEQLVRILLSYIIRTSLS